MLRSTDRFLKSRSCITTVVISDTANVEEFLDRMNEARWANDLLGRRKDAEFLIRFLLRRREERNRAGMKGSYVLNVNAPWGFGKSYFIRGMAEDLKCEFPVVLIDAWKNDFSDDPYTMVISEINAVLEPLIATTGTSGEAVRKTLKAVRRNAGKILLAGAKGAAKKFVVKVTGESGDQVIDYMTGEGENTPGAAGVGKKEASTIESTGKAAFDAMGESLAEIPERLLDKYASKMIDDYQEVKCSQEEFQRNLSALLKGFDAVSELHLPLFVIIDELDRCRPTYAITLLERIKHLFDIEEIVFVVATDTEQLQKAISGLYGANFDGGGYLQRFFTRTFSLPKPTTREFIDAMIAASGVDTSKWHAISESDDCAAFLAQMSEHLQLGLRGIQRSMEILFDLTTSWQEEYRIELCLMFPMIASYIRSEETDDFGDDSWLTRSKNNYRTWDMKVRFFDSGGPQESRFNVYEYVHALYTAANQDLYSHLTSLHEISGNAGPIKFSRDVLDREYRIRFQNFVRQGEVSMLSKYPKLIKYAGNMT